MMKFIMKHLMFNCREATLLMGKKEEGLLTLMEKIKLSMHVSMCSICKKFEIQSDEISKQCKQIHTEDSLPAISKQKIESMLKNYSSENDRSA